ncbi:hypothetical protein BSMD_021490 [Bacillus subtilis Miyagi-4]|nr:hypothetical protein BSMD_021490 [Bacillus subtilis Miyagi-4]
MILVITNLAPPLSNCQFLKICYKRRIQIFHIGMANGIMVSMKKNGMHTEWGE